MARWGPGRSGARHCRGRRSASIICRGPGGCREISSPSEAWLPATAPFEFPLEAGFLEPATAILGFIADLPAEDLFSHVVEVARQRLESLGLPCPPSGSAAERQRRSQLPEMEQLILEARDLVKRAPDEGDGERAALLARALSLLGRDTRQATQKRPATVRCPAGVDGGQAGNTRVGAAS